jgi:F0F1-type ATP synthase membrane subunit c/vacuolar-type H+-ATPase subunit K
MPDAQPVPSRNVWLLIACSMVMAACLYALVITLLFASGPPPAAPDTPLPRALFWSAAAAFVVASMLWTQLRVRAPIDQALSTQPPAPLFTVAEFQARSIISLALAEAACVVGFVQAMMYHAPVRDYLPFGAATVLVIVLDVIPTGLRYWSSRDA